MAEEYTGEVIPLTGGGPKPYTGEVLPLGGKPKAPEDEFSFLKTLNAPFKFATDVTEPLAAAATGFPLKFAGDVAGMAAIPLHAAGIVKTDPKKISEDIQSYAYEPKSAIGQSKLNPLNWPGMAFNWAGEKTEELLAPPATAGPLRSALASGAGEAVKQSPMLFGAWLPSAAGGTQTALRGGAERLMTSALKPTIKAHETGKAGRAVDTLLEEGINVTPGGVEALQGRIDGLNHNIANLIANSPATIDRASVMTRLTDTFDRFSQQVDSLNDLAAIQRVGDNFMNNPLAPADIPVATAQALKQGTYRALGSKSYGELKGAEVEAQKALARGLKEEIAAAVPEVRTLNAQESRLLNALEPTERRVMISANKNPMGLGWLSLNPYHMGMWLMDRSELFKSLVARMLNTGSRMTPDMDVAGPLGGMAVYGQEQTNQLRAPPLPMRQ